MSLKYTSLLALAPLVAAHGWVNSWVIDGKSYDGFVPSDVNRFPKSAARPTDNPDHGYVTPENKITACGGASPGQGRETWDINGGSQITVNWISDDRLEPNMVWPREHKGAIMEYMAECPTGDCNGVDSWELDWFKISEQGVNGQHWATDQLNETRIWSFTIPENIKPGAYLVRHELNAMHNRTNGETHLQVYPVCIQTNVVSSSANAVPAETVKFPNAYADGSQDFRTIEVFKRELEGGDVQFTPPGPRVAELVDGGSSGAGAGTGSSAASSAAGSSSTGTTNTSSSDNNDDTAAPSMSSATSEPIQSDTTNSGTGNDDTAAGAGSDGAAVTQDSPAGSGSGSGATTPVEESSPSQTQQAQPSYTSSYGRGGGRRGGRRQRACVH